MGLRIRVLGELALELDRDPLDPPSSRRARSLLGLLAVERRMHARSELAARFWPNVLDESARTSLRSALSAIRRGLGPDADRYVLATRESVGLAEDVWTDVAEFERFVGTHHAAEAMELWRGNLLTGLDDDWILEARDEWRERAAGVLAGLAAAAEANGDLAAAIAHTRRMVALDPLGEEGQRELIRRLHAGGDRAAALNAYGRYSERLRNELRIAPSPSTRALVEGLREEDQEADGAVAELPVSEAAAPAPRVPVSSDAASGTVTLLFTDLVGSTELLDELGDEEAERLRRIHFGLLRDVALSHSGHEVKSLGDGLMVAFGSSVDAAACAVGIQQAVHRHNRREGNERLRVRVGLNVGEPIRDEGDYFGTSVVIAKRLCDRAEGSQILTSDLVRALVGSRGGFTFQPLGDLALKGIKTPVAGCELTWEPTEELRLPLPGPLAREAGALVGREDELRRLEAARRGVGEGRPGVFLIAGEPGVGKTRLVAELCREAHREGATILLGRSYEETLVPYEPFVEALRHYVSSCPVDELRLQVGTRRGVLARIVPELTGAGEEASRHGDDPEAERYALFDAVASLLREAADARSLVLVLDDLHWADEPSLLLLRHLARAAEAAPLLIVGTYRDTEVREGDPLAATLAELRRARALDSLSLAGLEPEQVVALIRARGVELENDLARAVAQRTEGNPFYVEEMVRHLGDGGELAVPESVKDLILRRLQELGEWDRRMLAAAATIGREFDLDLLERVTGTGGDELLDSVERGVAERVLVESPDAIGRYAFTHSLVRETIYDELSTTRRARLHLRVGEAIAGQDSERDEDVAALAHHFTLGGDYARGFEHQLPAARAAARVYALDAALAHYEAAREAGSRLGLTAADERIRELPLEIGWVHHMRGDSDASASYRTALENAREAGDRRLEARALDRLAFLEKGWDIEQAIAYHEQALRIAEELEDTPIQVGVLNRLSLEHSNQLDLARAIETGERALMLAEETADDHDRARALDALKLAALQLGDLDRLEQLTAELEEIERGQGDLWYLQWTLLESAFVPIGRMDASEAAAKLDEAHAVSRRVGEGSMAPIRDASGWLARSRGDFAAALEHGRVAIEHSDRRGRLSPWSAWTRATLGWTLLDLRAADEAVAVLEPGLAFARWQADRFRTAGHLAWARALAGDLAGSEEAAAEAEDVLAGLSAPPGGAFLFGFGAAVALARAHLAAARPQRGEELLAPFRVAAESSGWLEAVASAMLVTGLCLTALADVDDAREMFVGAAEMARSHQLPGIAWEALAELSRLQKGEEAERSRAESAAIVERLAAGVGDEGLTAGLLRGAER